MRRERKRALTRDASSQKLEIGKREHHRLEQDEAGGVFLAEIGSLEGVRTKGK